MEKIRRRGTKERGEGRGAEEREGRRDTKKREGTPKRFGLSF